jgi:hypothetical protein
MYYRCAAIYPPIEAYLGTVDIVIPMWNEEEDTVCVILAQTKIPASSTHSKKRLTSDKNHVPCMRILLSVGCGTKEEP